MTDLRAYNTDCTFVPEHISSWFILQSCIWLILFLLDVSTEAEHGYASVLPYSDDFSRKKTKPTTISRKPPNNR